MKNYILIFAFLFCATSATMADGNLCEGIQIPVTIKKGNTSGSVDAPRTPLNPPMIYQKRIQELCNVLGRCKWK